MDLAAFAEKEAEPKGRSVIDALPDDVKAQIRASSAPHTVVAKWLKSEHGLDLSSNAVAQWRKKGTS